MGVQLLRPLPASELRGAVLPAVEPLRRQAGVQLEGVPADLNSALSCQGAQGFLQPALADVAPGADDVRDHVHRPGHGAVPPPGTLATCPRAGYPLASTGEANGVPNARRATR